MDKVFLDTNIILDFLDGNRPTHGDSTIIIQECIYGIIQGFISESVITNCAYLLQKRFSQPELNKLVLGFSKYLKVLPLTDSHLMAACKINKKDLEDTILYTIALENGCRYFITSNVKDFLGIQNQELPVLSPGQYLQKRNEFQ